MRAQGLRPRGVLANLAMTIRLVLPAHVATRTALQLSFFEVQWLARICPCQRFAGCLTATVA